MIINSQKLNEMGYKTNSKKTAICPITKKDYCFSIKENGFLIMFNDYELGECENSIKFKIIDLIKKLASNGAVTYIQDELLKVRY